MSEALIQLRCTRTNPWPYNPGERLAKSRRQAAVLLKSGAFELVRANEPPPDDFTAIRGIDAAASARLVEAGIRTYGDLARPGSDEAQGRIDSLSLGDGAHRAIRQFQEDASSNGLAATVRDLEFGDLEDVPGVGSATAAKLGVVGIETVADLRGAPPEKLEEAGIAGKPLEKIIAWQESQAGAAGGENNE